MDISLLQSFYRGFSIEQPVGNNAFSYRMRRHRQIYVPPLIAGGLSDLDVGEAIAFVEVEDGREISNRGLRNFIYWHRGHQDVFIFDNHNHAFFFWLAGVYFGRISAGLPLRHVDQHTDMRHPPSPPPISIEKIDLAAAFTYTQEVLNVGNFIQPAIKLGVFSRVEIVDSSAAFADAHAAIPVLDLDMDIFSEDMRYLGEAYKLERIREFVRPARFITIATSPFFMDPSAAIEWIRRIFDAE